MPFCADKIANRIKSIDNFNDLYEYLRNMQSWDYYYDVILEKLQTLPLTNFSNIIWEMLRKKNSWIQAVQILSNRIVNEGLMDSDKTWEDSVEIIPVIVIMTNLDRSRIDLKYLAITLSAMRGYQDDFPFHEYLTDDCSIYLRNMFTQSGYNTTGNLPRQIDPANMGGTVARWVQDNIAAINILTSIEARDQFFEDLLEDKVHGECADLLQKMSIVATSKIRGVVGETEDDEPAITAEEICDWATYLVVTLQSIYKKYALTWTSLLIQKHIISEWSISLTNLINTLPWDKDKNAAVVEILIPLSINYMHQVYPHSSKDYWVDSLDNILTAVRVNAQTGVEIQPQFQLATEASYKDFDSRYPEEDNEDESDSDGDNDSDDGDTAEDRKARREDTYGKDRRKKMGKTTDYDNDTTMTDKAARKIYAGYRAYRDNVEKVDGQITKIVEGLKDRKHRKIREQIVEGKKFSLIRILKKVMSTAAVFSYSKIAGILFIVVRHFRSNAATNQERISMLEELQLEIKMLDEKIEDARGDGNRQAKYAMMRTRSELQKAYDQIKYGLTAGAKAKRTARDLVRHKLDLGRES